MTLIAVLTNSRQITKQIISKFNVPRPRDDSLDIPWPGGRYAMWTRSETDCPLIDSLISISSTFWWGVNPLDYQMHHIPPTGRKEELHNYWVGLIFALEEEEETVPGMLPSCSLTSYLIVLSAEEGVQRHCWIFYIFLVFFPESVKNKYPPSLTLPRTLWLACLELSNFLSLLQFVWVSSAEDLYDHITIYCPTIHTSPPFLVKPSSVYVEDINDAETGRWLSGGMFREVGCLYSYRS